MIALDVIDQDDEDIMRVTDAHERALVLCRMCADGYYKHGGRTPVGPREVVYISVYGTTPVTVKAADRAAQQSSYAVTKQIKRMDPDLLNTSSTALAGMSVLNSSIADTGDCFSASEPRPRRHLYPVKTLDCFDAGDEIVKNRPPRAEMTFGRRRGMDFQLPWRAQRGSCIVLLDTFGDINFDTLVLWNVYQTALNLIEECTTDPTIFGGSRTVGVRKIVSVVVFGFESPSQASAPTLSAPTHVVARAQVENGELSLLDTSILRTTRPASALVTGAPAVVGMPECFDAPLPREHSVPISNFTDCEVASFDIIGSRARSQIYVFSRKPSTDPDHFQLPATFRTGTCVIHLDVEHEDDEDTVRLGYVESTAWVLAHKCSGLENPEQRWGGTATVSVGAQDLIRVWVYGAVAQTLEERWPSRVVSLPENE